MNFAIIGATGNVGRKTIEVLEKSNIQINNLYLVASKKSAGKTLTFKKKEIKVEQLENCVRLLIERSNQVQHPNHPNRHPFCNPQKTSKVFNLPERW